MSKSLSSQRKTKTGKPVLLEEEMKVFLLKISQIESVRIMQSGDGRLYIPIMDLAIYLGYENLQREQYIRRGMSRIYIVKENGQKTKLVDIEDCIDFMSNLRGVRLDKATRFSLALEQECRKSAAICSMDKDVFVQELSELYSILDQISMKQSQLMMFIEKSPLSTLIRSERNRTITERISRVKESYSRFLDSVGNVTPDFVPGSDPIGAQSSEIRF